MDNDTIRKGKRPASDNPLGLDTADGFPIGPPEKRPKIPEEALFLASCTPEQLGMLRRLFIAKEEAVRAEELEEAKSERAKLIKEATTDLPPFSDDEESNDSEEETTPKKEMIAKDEPAQSEETAQVAAETALAEAVEGSAQTLEPEQRAIWDAAMSGKSIFFTGAAGTGKSFLLRKIIAELQQIHGRSTVFVTAPTGVAACNISGSTLHHFAGLGLANDPLPVLIKKAKQQPKLIARWTKARVLVIDEISMVTKEFFANLDIIGRHLRMNNSQPFGGIQVILCGDFFQLPPVVKPLPGEKKSDTAERLEFCFETDAWRELVGKNSFMLTKVYRQITDPTFTGVLNNARVGNMQFIEKLRLSECVGRQWKLTEQERETNGGSDEVPRVAIYSHHEDVDRYNHSNLIRLPGRHYAFRAKDGGPAGFETHLKSCPVPDMLTLRKGAQVLLLKNLSVSGGLVNGTRGVVTGFKEMRQSDIDKELNGVGIGDEETDDEREGNNEEKPRAATPPPKPPTDPKNDKIVETRPIVLFENGLTRIITKADWQITSGEDVLAWREQYPLCLAWAITIHKSQGMTLTRAEIDLSRIFEYGQAYVALSRVTSMEGLRITKEFDIEKIRAHPKVKQFYQSLRAANSSIITSTSATTAATTLQQKQTNRRTSEPESDGDDDDDMAPW